MAMLALEVKRGMLQGSLTSLMLDILYEIEAPKGRRRFIILSKSVYSAEVIVDSVSPIEHSHNFRQSYLRLAETVVGSMLDVSSRWCKYNGLCVAYMPPQDMLHEFTCPTEQPSGGLLVYQDNHGAFFAKPAKHAQSALLVTDRGD
ncbi:hypothetical protein fHeYen902_063c [Yersinia phage fHe-Yen9-02]|nr:hypothetical protein fHeYen902_063c [Yersinia phage fHe-Yen9-02]